MGFQIYLCSPRQILLFSVRDNIFSFTHPCFVPVVKLWTRLSEDVSSIDLNKVWVHIIKVGIGGALYTCDAFYYEIIFLKLKFSNWFHKYILYS